MVAVKDKSWFLRGGLFAKYVVALVGLVVFVLAVNGATETWISYRATKTTLTDAMAEKAEATAKRIDQAVSELERQISVATRASVDTVDKRRAAYLQLLNQVPAVSQLTQLNGQGRELLRLSRTSVAENSGADLSDDSRFTETVSRGVNYAPASVEAAHPAISTSVSWRTSSPTRRSARPISPTSSIRAARCWRVPARARRSARASRSCRRSRP
jgi:adenylate cyclase